MLFMALALSCSFSMVRAQGPGGPGPDPDPGIPFDGGISLVVIAGIAYAAKKGLDKKKKELGNETVEK